jgi:cytochrome c oxidase cbb3-type subunit III
MALALLMASCEREQRQFRAVPGAASRGGATATASAIAEGKRLYQQFNCVGCHGHGGGGIGPPLMDAEWIHGSEPHVIGTVIVEGSPNGMPAFRGKIPDAQLWQLVAYVRSLSGLLPPDTAPGRSDHMQVTTPAPPKPTIQARQLLEMRAAEDAALHSYGWVDRPAGVVRMPIDRAMELVLDRGLPVRAQPPESARLSEAGEASP